MRISVQIRGLDEVQKKLRQVKEDLRGTPMEQGMKQATLLVERSAKQKAPKDTGTLAASINSDVTRGGNSVIGIIGTRIKYAPFVELGSRPHFPPMQNIAPWARRHGLSAYGAAVAIAARGTRARHFFRGALEDNEEKIIDLIGDVVAKIVTK